jgi:hypothetical protein
VLLKKIQHSIIQRALLGDQVSPKKGDDKYIDKDSKSQEDRTLTSGTSIDSLQDPQRGSRIV